MNDDLRILIGMARQHAEITAAIAEKLKTMCASYGYTTVARAIGGKEGPLWMVVNRSKAGVTAAMIERITALPVPEASIPDLVSVIDTLVPAPVTIEQPDPPAKPTAPYHRRWLQYLAISKRWRGLLHRLGDS